MKKINFFKQLLFIPFVFVFFNVLNAQTYTIPVVVHNLHDGQFTGYLDELVVEAKIQELNNFFDNFTSPLIQFQLAKVDPFGNCTNGIEYIETDSPIGSFNNFNIDFNLKNTTRWPSNKYLNIWTVTNIDNGSYAGYVQRLCNVNQSTSTPTEYCGDIEFQSSNPAILDGTVLLFDADPYVWAHEVGHWLNLWHTHGPDSNSGGSWVGCDTPSNCQSQGDFVCDTPPVNRFTVPPPIYCDPIPPATEINTCNTDVPDLPDQVENLMSITDCPYSSRILTPGQLTRMENHLLTERTTLISATNLLETGLLGFFGADVVISANGSFQAGNLPNNGDIFIIGDLTIEPGVDFSIASDVSVRFCEDAKVIVKEGATFTLHGELTSLGSGAKWGGIELWNTSGASYADQTKFFAYYLATISNAKVGVKNYSSSFSGLSGGVVQLQGTIVDNCDIGVELGAYQDKTYFLALNTTFINNDNPDFTSFVKMDRVQGGIRIQNSDFISSSSSNCINDFGIGILAIDSRFHVHDNNVFDGLGYGIRAESVSTSKPFIVAENNSFDGCFRGIYSNGVGNFKIWSNSFDHDTPVHASGPYYTCSGAVVDINSQIGITLESSMLGVDIQENDFVDNSTWDIANIATNGLGTTNNKIRSNDMEGDCGIYAEGQNSTIFFSGSNPSVHKGLFFSCNDMDSEGIAAYADGIAGNMLSLRKAQVNLDDAGLILSAANLFHTNSSNHIINKNLAHDILYYHSTASGEEPDNLKVEGVEKRPGTFANCIVEVIDVVFEDPPQGPNGPEGPQKPQIGFEGLQPDDVPTLVIAHNDLQDDISDALATYDPQMPSTSLEELEMELTGLLEKDDRVVADILYIYQTYDEVWDESAYLFYLGELHSYATDLLAVKYFVGQEDWTAASTLLNTLPNEYDYITATTPDYVDFLALYNLLNTTSLYALNTQQISGLEVIAESEKGNARGWARAILLHYGYLYDADVDLGIVQNREVLDSDIDKEVSDIFLLPNPASDVIVLSQSEFGFSYKSIHVVFYDNAGRIVKSLESNFDKRINISELHSGIYMVQVKHDGVLLATRKLIKL